MALNQFASDLASYLGTPALGWTVLVALLLFLIPPARNLAIEVICSVYVAIFHLPFRSSLISFLFAGQHHPLPRSDSTWSRIQACTTLKWRANHKGLNHERQINWQQQDTPRHGDMIEAWDRVAEWDKDCIHPSKLEQLRRVGDPLADNALEKVEQQPPAGHQITTDTLRKIYDQASNSQGPSNTASQRVAETCQIFWKAIDRRPPPGAGALSLDWYRSRHPTFATESLDRWPKFPSTSQPESTATVPIWSPHSTVSFDAQTEQQEIEAEAEVLRRGQDVFYRYAGPMLTVLLHFSLAGGFASPRITEVLKQTAYLVPSANGARAQSSRTSRKGPPSFPTVDELKQNFNVDKNRADRTWTRLLETTQFVLDVVEHADSLRPPSANVSSSSTGSTPNGKGTLASPDLGGQGWQSAIRVRLLHTNVRRRILKLVEKNKVGSSVPAMNTYDIKKDGVPINQEDLLGTLCAFSVAPLAMLQRIGIYPSQQERQDFIALWRHVGFYMGIEPALLRTAFCDSQAADRTLWCTILHLFSRVEITSDQHSECLDVSGPVMQGPTNPVLIACANRPPFNMPLSAHVAISRRLLGNSLADALFLPASSATREVQTDIAFFGMRIPILFGSVYPRRSWEKRRLRLARPLLRRLVVFSFGNKRTKFEMPAQPARSASEKTEKASGERVNVETRSDSHVDVAVDKEHVMDLARQWRWLMREMIVVIGLTILLFSISDAFATYTIRRKVVHFT